MGVLYLKTPIVVLKSEVHDIVGPADQLDTMSMQNLNK